MGMTRSVLIVGGTVAVGLALIGLLALSSRPPASERGPVTYVEDPEALRGLIALERMGIATAENFVGHRIRVIEGTVRNVSDRPIRSIELHLEFKGDDGATIFASDGEALRMSLPPGEARRYEFRFENLSEEWNFRIPEVTVRRVGY
jgi:hypothetical protein